MKCRFITLSLHAFADIAEWILDRWVLDRYVLKEQNVLKEQKCLKYLECLKCVMTKKKEEGGSSASNKTSLFK